MNDTVSLECYLCGSSEHRQRVGKVRDDASMKINECCRCGLVFLSHGEKSLDFYAGSGMHGGQSPTVEKWTNETDRDDDRRFHYLSEAITNQDVLDFGCGTGGFLLKARSRARFVMGIEPEYRLKGHFSTNCLQVVRNVTEIPSDQKFDLITAFHVIEHLQDPANTLRQLVSSLRRGGSIVFEIPSAADVLLSLYDSIPFSEFTYWSCHLYLFSVANLPLLAKKAGLKLDYLKQIQRYPLANHLYWLAKGEPGGHKKWHFMDTPELNSAYEKQLASLGKCDTIIGSFSHV